jgi:hypothetical protein
MVEGMKRSIAATRSLPYDFACLYVTCCSVTLAYETRLHCSDTWAKAHAPPARVTVGRGAHDHSACCPSAPIAGCAEGQHMYMTVCNFIQALFALGPAARCHVELTLTWC